MCRKGNTAASPISSHVVQIFFKCHTCLVTAILMLPGNRGPVSSLAFRLRRNWRFDTITVLANCCPTHQTFTRTKTKETLHQGKLVRVTGAILWCKTWEGKKHAKLLVLMWTDMLNFKVDFFSSSDRKLYNCCQEFTNSERCSSPSHNNGEQRKYQFFPLQLVPFCPMYPPSIHPPHRSYFINITSCPARRCLGIRAPLNFVASLPWLHSASSLPDRNTDDPIEKFCSAVNFCWLQKEKVFFEW